MPLAPLWSIHFYGPGLMGAAVSTVTPTQEITGRGEGRMHVQNTAAPDDDLNLQRTLKMRVENTPDPTEDLTMRGQAYLQVISKVNELTQDDIVGAVLTTQIAPGLTFADALVDARKAAKLAAALSA